MRFEELVVLGRQSEDSFTNLMREHGYTTCYLSQHRDNPQNSLASHFPDIFVVELATFFQVKNGKKSGKWPSVIAQKKSYDAATETSEHGSVVWMVWEMPDNNFKGNNVNMLSPGGEISEEARQHGSGTSAYKFLKSQLISIDVLLRAQHGKKDLD